MTTQQPEHKCSLCGFEMERPGFKSPTTKQEICEWCWLKFSFGQQLVFPFMEDAA